LNEYLFSRLGHREIRPIAVGLRVGPGWSKNRCAEGGFKRTASNAR
jgi:hypothetical protein